MIFPLIVNGQWTPFGGVHSEAQMEPQSEEGKQPFTYHQKGFSNLTKPQGSTSYIKEQFLLA